MLLHRRAALLLHFQAWVLGRPQPKARQAGPGSAQRPWRVTRDRSRPDETHSLLISRVCQAGAPRSRSKRRSRCPHTLSTGSASHRFGTSRTRGLPRVLSRSLGEVGVTRPADRSHHERGQPLRRPLREASLRECRSPEKVMTAKWNSIAQSRRTRLSSNNDTDVRCAIRLTAIRPTAGRRNSTPSPSSSGGRNGGPLASPSRQCCNRPVN